MKSRNCNGTKVERKCVLPRIKGAQIPKENLPGLPEKYREFSDRELEDVFSEKLWRYPKRLGKRTKSSCSSEASQINSSAPDSNLALIWSKELTDDLKLLSNVPGTRRNSLQTRDIEDYVKNYADRRIIGDDFEGDSILLQSQKQKSEKRMEIASAALPLSFTKDVIHARADPVVLPYDEKKEAQLYKYKPECCAGDEQKKTKPIEPRIVTKHKLCMPPPDPNAYIRPKLQLRPRRNSEDREILARDVPNSTHVWEQYVMGLVSKRTAQWIANQCATGNQRSRLVTYLDEMYEEVYPGGTENVKKLLDNNDDCITVPRKWGETGTEEDTEADGR